MGVEKIYLKKYTKTFKKDEVIFRENEKTKEMYFILSGTVEIFKTINGVEETLSTLKEGDFFGEMSLILDERTIASAVTHTGAECLAVNLETFQSFISASPDFTMKIIKTLCQRISNTDHHLSEWILKYEIDKIRNALIRIATDDGKKPLKNIKLNYKEIVENLADLFNIKSIHVIKALETIIKGKGISLVREKDVNYLLIDEKFEHN